MERPTDVPAGQRIVNYNVRVWSQTSSLCTNFLSVASCSGLPNNNWMFRDYSYFYQVKIQYPIFEPWPAIPWFNQYLFILICKFCNPFPRYINEIHWNPGLIVDCSSFWVLSWGYFTLGGWAYDPKSFRKQSKRVIQNRKDPKEIGSLNAIHIIDFSSQ